MILIDSGITHNFVNAALPQSVQVITINVKPKLITLGNKYKVLSNKLAKLRILFTFVTAQMVQCHVMPKLRAPVILGMDWLTQLNLKINWSEKTIKWTTNNINMFLKAYHSSKIYASVVSLNLISLQQLKNLVCMTKGKNLHTWIVHCSAYN